jgi:hypothetical protein
MTHLQKWTEVCQELEQAFPNYHGLLFVQGYVFGLKHAADMASHSPNTADNAQPKCTLNLPPENHDKDNSTTLKS